MKNNNHFTANVFKSYLTDNDFKEFNIDKDISDKDLNVLMISNKELFNRFNENFNKSNNSITDSLNNIYDKLNYRKMVKDITKLNQITKYLNRSHFYLYMCWALFFLFLFFILKLILVNQTGYIILFVLLWYLSLILTIPLFKEIFYNDNIYYKHMYEKINTSMEKIYKIEDKIDNMEQTNMIIENKSSTLSLKIKQLEENNQINKNNIKYTKIVLNDIYKEIEFFKNNTLKD